MQIRPFSSAPDLSLFASKASNQAKKKNQRKSSLNLAEREKFQEKNNASSANSKQLSEKYLAALIPPTKNSNYETSKVNSINEFLESTRGGLEDLVILESALNASLMFGTSASTTKEIFKKVSEIYWEQIGMPFSRIKLNKLYEVFPRASFIFALNNFEIAEIKREMSRIYQEAYPLSTLSNKPKNIKFQQNLQAFVRQLPKHLDTELRQSISRLFADSLSTLLKDNQNHFDHPSNPRNQIMTSLKDGTVLLCREILESLTKDFPKDLRGFTVEQVIGSGVSSTGSKPDPEKSNFHKHTRGLEMKAGNVTITYIDHEPPHGPNPSTIFEISLSPEGQVTRIKDYDPKQGKPKTEQSIANTALLRTKLSSAISTYLPHSVLSNWGNETNFPIIRTKISYCDPETDKVKTRWLTPNDPQQQELKDYSKKHSIAYRSFLEDLDVRNHK